MPMNRRERDYIEYRPDLRLNVDLLAIVRAESPTREYHAPEEVKEALEKSACSVLGKALDTLEKTDDFMDNLEENLKDDVANGVSFQDYINNRDSEEGDPSIVHQWEDYHSLNINGKLLGEVYSVVTNVRQNLVDTINLLNNELVVGDINHDTHGAVCAAEEKKLDNLIRNDIAQKDPAALEELKTRNELLDVIDGAVDGIKNFIDNAAGLADLTVDDLFRNDINSVVNLMAEAKPQNLDILERLSEIGFAQVAHVGQDIKQRMDRVKNANDILFEESRELRKLKLDSGKTLAWLMDVDTNFDESSVTEVIDNTLLSVTTVLDGYDAVLADMHKTNEMAAMQFDDVLDNLYLKESHRQQNRVVKDVKKYFDKSDPDRDRQLKRFSQNMGYQKGIKKKKSHKKRGLVRGTK